MANGFECIHCGAIGTAYRLADLSWWCPTWDTRTSVTAGTIFHRTRTPLTVWFAAAWFLTSQKDGTSALRLQPIFGLGSHQRRGQRCIGCARRWPGPGATGSPGWSRWTRRSLAAYGLEVKEAARPARRSWSVWVSSAGRREASGAVACPCSRTPRRSRSLHSWLPTSSPGSTVVTDGWQPYKGALAGTYGHERYVAPGPLAHELLPGVHRVASLLDRWLLSTHQGAVEGDHVQAYLDEFCFRFNRRNARSRGLLFRRLLEQSVDTGPRTYAQLVVNPRNATAKQLAALVRAPIGKRVAPASLAMPAQGRPWRR